MNIVFHADLSKYVAHRPSVLYWVLQPGADVGGIGMGLVRMVRPVERVADRLGLRHQRAAARGRRGGRHRGRPRPRRRRHDRRSTLRSTSLWGNNKMYATRYADGPRVLHGRRRATGTRRRTGWAPTRRSRTPTTSPGSSRSCCEGKAAPALLDSYDAERAPIGKQIVTAREPEHRGVRADLRGARRARHHRPRADAREHRRAQGRHAEAARAAREAARGDRAQELRVQRPRRRARPALPLRRGGPRRHARAGVRRATPSSTTTRRPGPARGCRTSWLEHRGGRKVLARHDLAGKGRFTLLTGIGGDALGRGRGRA